MSDRFASIAISNFPGAEGDCHLHGLISPLDPGLELCTIEAKAVREFERPVKKDSEMRALTGSLRRHRNYRHISGMTILTPEKGKPFHAIIDGELIGPMYKMLIRPSIAPDGLERRLPLQSFLPVDV